MSIHAVADAIDPAITSGADTGQAAMRLVAAIQALSLARDLDTIIGIVRREARAISRSDGATFILRDGDKCYYVDEDAISPLWKGRRFPLSTCISGWAMTNRRAASIENIYEDERIPVEAYRPTFVKSLLMTPIRAEDPVGAIGIYWAQRHAASDAEIELLQALAGSTAVAMENVLLYRELDQRVDERTRQLEDTNRELEAFSYSVSHDLQAPLRHVTSYCELLARHYTETLDEEGRGWLDRIRGSAGHMSELIQDLLRLARYTRVELMESSIDLSRIVREEVALLREENPGREVDLQVEDGVQARGDESLLRIVLQNLVANAWKFTAKRERTRIEFGTVPHEDGALAYFVRDNGAGFNMQYAHRLFAPFQRLHAARDFNGTGIGLATVKRIVHRHGGMVWADASVDRGAAFFFTLKPAPPRANFVAMKDGGASYQ